MSVSNSLVAAEKQKFSVAIQGEKYKALINNTLGDPKVAQRFIASVTSAVSVNPALQGCEPSTILSAALLGEGLKLSPSPQLGQFYMVPFDDKKNNRKVATFVLGYKGMIQLAIRSGYYKKINVLPIKKGELIRFDPMTEEIEVKLIDDDDEREKADTIGYYAMFEYLNGFVKAMYWTQSKMERHADQFSKAFNLEAYRKIKDGKIPQADMWKYSSFWYKSFEDMACKTMLRQIIGKWGIMSIELQQAFEQDDKYGEVTPDGKIDYVDPVDVPATIENAEPAAEAPAEKPKRGAAKKQAAQEPEIVDNPFEGDPFNAENAVDVPEFVTEVEEGEGGERW